MISKKRFIPFVVIGFCLLFAFLYLVISPPTSAPDEIAHLAYPRFLLQENQLPSFTSAEDFWESHQPPLYYILSIPVVKLFTSLPIFDQLQLNRIISFFIYGASLWIYYVLVKKLFPDKYFLQSSALCLLGIPMVSYLAGSFSNDILMILISVVMAYWVLIGKDKKFSSKEAIFFGLCIGLGLLTKIHIYPLIFFAWLFVLWKRPLIIWVLTSFFAFLASFWWFLHNLIHTGDIFGLSHTFILWESQKQKIASLPDFFTLCGKLYSGFLGVFGKFSIAYPTILYIISSLAFIYFCVFLIKNLKDIRIKKIFVIIFSILGFVIIQNFSFYQPQGRYLISVIPFLGIGLAIVVQKFRSDTSRTALFFSLVLFLFFLNIYGLVLIHSYYKKNPVESLKDTRTINLLEKKFIGDTERIKKSTAAIEVFLPATIATLQDLRLNSDKNPTIHITTSNQNEYSIVLKWKRLGDTSFAFSRSLKQAIIGTAEIEIQEPQNTLIQDIQVEIQGMHDSITITEFSIYTR